MNMVDKLFGELLEAGKVPSSGRNMSYETDQIYWERRARQERELAEKALGPSSYRIHTDLARRYEQKLLSLLRSASDRRQ